MSPSTNGKAHSSVPVAAATSISLEVRDGGEGAPAHLPLLGAGALAVRPDPLQPDRYWLVLRAEDGGYPLIHRDPCRDLAEVDEKGAAIQVYLQALGVRMARERAQDLLHCDQMAKLRSKVLAIADELVMNRDLIDLDLTGAVPCVFEGAREGDLVGIFFFARAQRLVVLPGAVSCGPGLPPVPRFESSQIAQFLGAGARPSAFILLKVTSSTRVRFQVLESCTMSTVRDIEARAMSLFEHPFSGLT